MFKLDGNGVYIILKFMHYCIVNKAGCILHIKVLLFFNIYIWLGLLKFIYNCSSHKVSVIYIVCLMTWDTRESFIIVSRLIPGLYPANDRHRYKVTPPPNGWVQTWNQSWQYRPNWDKDDRILHKKIDLLSNTMNSPVDSHTKDQQCWVLLVALLLAWTSY